MRAVPVVSPARKTASAEPAGSTYTTSLTGDVHDFDFLAGVQAHDLADLARDHDLKLGRNFDPSHRYCYC